MAETLGKAPKAPKKPKAGAETPGDNVVQLDNTPPEERLATLLLNGISDLRAMDEKIDAATAKVKGLRADRKAITGRLGAAGIPAAIIEEGMKKAEQTRSDQSAYEATRAFVWKTMGLATADWAASLETTPSPAVDELTAEADGYTAGVMAKDCVPPTSLSPALQQSWLRGYHKVTEQRGMAMAPKPTVAPVEANQKPASDYILSECDFEDGTALEDASLLTIKSGSRQQVDEFDRVIVRFGDKQRVLKEPGYLDDGTDAAGVSEIEDVPADAG